MTFHVDSEVGRLQTGHRAPPRARAGPPHPRQRRRAALRRRHVGTPGSGGARRLRRAARGRTGCVVHQFADAARRGARPARGTRVPAGRLTTATRFGPALDEPLDELVASTPAHQLAELLIGGVLKRDVAASCRDAQPAAGVPARRRLPAARRCPTTCSSGTTRPGSTTGCRSTRWPSRPASGRRSTPGSSTTSTRCSPMPRSRSSTATTPRHTNRPPSRAATSPSSGTAR